MLPHVEEVRRVEERADGNQEETFVCTAYSENIVMDALENDKVVALGQVISSS